jgi:hypothetical protein
MIWKNIPGYYNYEINEMGLVRNGEYIRKPSYKNGYLRIILSRNNSKTNFYVHKLVAITFIGNRPIGHEIHHKDGNKLNNHHSNLEYVPSVNHKRNRWIKYPLVFLGEANPMAKLTSEDVLKIRKIYSEGIGPKKISELFDLSPKYVGEIVSRKRWKHL